MSRSVGWVEDDRERLPVDRASLFEAAYDLLWRFVETNRDESDVRPKTTLGPQEKHGGPNFVGRERVERMPWKRDRLSSTPGLTRASK